MSRKLKRIEAKRGLPQDIKSTFPVRLIPIAIKLSQATRCTNFGSVVISNMCERFNVAKGLI
jgi:hypothetical protein